MHVGLIIYPLHNPQVSKGFRSPAYIFLCLDDWNNIVEQIVKWYRLAVMMMTTKGDDDDDIMILFKLFLFFLNK